MTGRRRPLQARISWDSYRLIQRMADEETGGNVSEMARILLAEAVTARRKANR